MCINEKIRTPQQVRGIETKKRIIDAAMRLFSQKGFHNTNSKEISTLAAVSIGSFYAYFQDKKQLFLEVLRDYYEQITTRIQLSDTFQETDIHKFLYSYISNTLRAHEFFPEFYREIIIMEYSDPVVKEIRNELEKQALDLTYNHLKIWQDQIRVKDLDVASFIIYTATKNIAHAVIFSKVDIKEDRLIRELVDMITRYLF
jgi:AcrR family transcriptional regulator